MTPTSTGSRSLIQSLNFLNTDGKPHPRENALAVLTLIGGLVSVALAFNEAWHVPGAWVGAATLVLGAIGQMISATTAQRWLCITGLVFAFIGTMVNVSHGGFV